MVWNFIHCNLMHVLRFHVRVSVCCQLPTNYTLYTVCYISACTVFWKSTVSFVNKVGNCSNDQCIGWNKLASVHPAGFVLANKLASVHPVGFEAIHLAGLISANKLASIHPASFEAVLQPVLKPAIIFQQSWIGPARFEAGRPASKWAGLRIGP